MAYLGKCYACEKDNEHRLPVYVKGRVRLICKKHGASTAVLFDAMCGDMAHRARIHKSLSGYNISRLRRSQVGAYFPEHGGREKYSKWETALKYAKEFVNH